LFCISFTVILNLDAVRINVCAVYILTLSDYFAKPFRQLRELSVDSEQASSASSAQQTADRTDGCAPPIILFPLTISARLKQCEVVLFAEPTKAASRVLLFKVS
jgi:hypothetical protein